MYGWITILMDNIWFVHFTELRFLLNAFPFFFSAQVLNPRTSLIQKGAASMGKDEDLKMDMQICNYLCWKQSKWKSYPSFHNFIYRCFRTSN